ncbi:MAG: hypothetical protein OXE04_05905 [bacterium]|nr:hypothetical protein [bacterium]MCY4257809.1 hypothetical protein [bacterium]
MARPSSSRKVARAASVGGDSTQRRWVGFPLVVALIIIAGTGVVAYAWQQREAESRPSLSDHWHSAYTVWDCTDADGEEGGHQPIFEGRRNSQGYPYDPDGIHSHSDGIIHIHPFTANAAGEDATMSKFFESMFVTMDQNGITASEFGVISAVDAECDGEPAVMQIVRWSNAITAVASEPDERIYEDFSDVHFQKDGEAFTIALAPRDAEVPLPLTVGDLLAVSPALVEDLSQPEGPVEFDTDLDPEAPAVRLEEDG